MGIAGHQAIAVRDFHAVAVAGLLPDEADLPFRGGIDRGPDRAPEIEPGVKGRAAGERIGAVAEARGDELQAGRQHLGNAFKPALERVHPRQALAEPAEPRIERAIG